ncbi:MAG: hydroxyethylthiazole kinase [Lachnospiraceae bacterium]|nr:hydroxyethylthiazole kinase [Lachnospiraceae bacterium]
MLNDKNLADAIEKMRAAVTGRAPLIHCITNPISIHDCANVVLAAGGRPMMAEHPEEVAEITLTAGALALNLGNITDARRASILIAGRTAMEAGIPVILDMVGIGCSSFRKDIIIEFLKHRIEGAKLILKGNMSELKALAGEEKCVSGVDVNPADMLSENNQGEAIALAKRMAVRYEAVILASGKTDLVTDGQKAFLIDNGCDMMGRITGTGCMLNVLTGTYMAAGEPLLAAVAGCVVLGISGEAGSEKSLGTGGFQVAFQDALSCMTDEDIRNRMKVRYIQE